MKKRIASLGKIRSLPSEATLKKRKQHVESKYLYCPDFEIN